MNWKDVGEVLAKSAPMIGGLLGGPPGAAVGAVGAMVASALGVAPVPDAVHDALMSNPDAAVKLATIEKDRQVELQSLSVQTAQARLMAETAEIQAASADRADARKREVASGDRATPRALAGIIVAGFLGMVWYVISGQVVALKDPVAAGLIGTLIGYVSAKADQVCNYYYGSTASSAHKNELLHNSMPVGRH